MIFLDKIQKYPRKSLEKALKDVMKSKNRMIAGRYSPKVFNMEYEEIEYKSIDGLNLYGWIIKKPNAKKTMIFLHGRNSNRIFCLKFLQLFLDMTLSEEYNIFIPDLRNSGRSDIAKTAFGYYFSKDIYSTVLYLNKTFNYNNFILYGFSQGAMGAAAMLYFYEKDLKEKNIVVEKLILDSPVSNVRKIILRNAYVFGIKVPYIINMIVLKKLDKIIDNNLDDLKLSKLLGVVPTLILQSEKDMTTPFEFMKEEYENLGENALRKTKFKAFRKGQHVRIYLQYKQEYTKAINDFLEKEI
ncbi:alpha/beta hydrolase [Oceanivirga salmonicida]|uniref:alpha/beta hydrolase n=1 Tax=Oceanivirga salmonicida TaxID=1769291 RepID=UPI0008328A96|nr:alpha/beta fold hydrolase [Oceanivirga salmonicida]